MSDEGDAQQKMPPGTQFTYLGRPCVVMRYADEAEARYSDTGFFGMVYEYADAHGVIHRNCVTPRDLLAFMAAVSVGGRA